MFSVLLLELILDRMSNDGGEVGCEDSDMKVVKDRKGRLSGEVFDFNAAFGRFVGAFYVPALCVEIFQFGQGKAFPVQERGEEDHPASVLDCEAEYPELQGSR